jgi:hypothetical protein
VFENTVLRGIFGSKREGVVGGWRRLLNEEVHNLYALPDVIMVIKSRTMKWEGHIAWMREMKNVYSIFVNT